MTYKFKRITGVVGKLSFAFAIGVGLGSCAKPHDNITTSAIGSDYRKTHPILVSDKTVDLKILADSQANELAFADQRRVEEFAFQFLRTGGSLLMVQTPINSENKAGIKNLLPQVIEVLKKNGLKKSQISVRTYREHDPSLPGIINLSYQTISASVHKCGQWADDLTDHFSNKNYGNFGCASQANFAAQLADPKDLVEPRGIGPIDAEERSNTIERYQQGN